MSSLWRIVKPKASINKCTNPSFTVASTGWSSITAATLTREMRAKARYGPWSLRVVSAGAADGVAAPTNTWNDTTIISVGCHLEVISGSVSVYWSRYSLGSPVQNVLIGTYAVGDHFVSLENYTVSAVTEWGLRFVGVSQFAVCGTMYEDGTALSTFIDGDQPGCYWDDTYGLSISRRSVYTRAGGELIDPETLGMLITDVTGIGYPPASVGTQDEMGGDGSVYDGTTFAERVFVLSGDVIGDDQEDLHAQRNDILELFDPDAVPDSQPVPLRYLGAGTSHPIEIRVIYGGGGEFAQIANTSERLSIRLVAPDPYFYDIWDTNYPLWASAYAVTANYGMVQTLDTGIYDGLDANGAVYCFAKTKDKTYIGGNFTTLGGTTVNYVACLYGGTLALGGTPGTGSYVLAMAVDAAGNLYVVGNFTTAGGGAANRVAKWDGSTWSALGTGLNGEARTIAIDVAGNVYVGGNFTTAGGGAANYIAKWNGSAWSALGTGMNGIVRSIAVDPLNGTDLYVGGSFTTAGGVTVNRIAKWNGSAWSALGSGANNPVNTVIALQNGDIYAGGDFTTMNGVTVNYVARYANRSSWQALGDGVSGGTIYWLYYDLERALLIASGTFTSAGGITVQDGIAFWNGYSWSFARIAIPGTPVVYAVQRDHTNRRLLFGFSTSGSLTVDNNSSLTNSCKMPVSPRLVVNRPAGTSLLVGALENHTTKKALLLNRSLLAGETIEADTRTGDVLSSLFGDMGRIVLRGSDFMNFKFIPGVNYFTWYSPYVGAGAVGAGTAYLTWRGCYRSADGAA